MIVSKKKFEQEVEKRITEIMCRREHDERIREVRHDLYMALDRLSERVDRIERVLKPVLDAGVEPANIWIEKR